MVPGLFDGGADGVEIDRQVIVGFTAESAKPRLVEGGLGFDARYDGLGLDQVKADGIEFWDEDKGGLEIVFVSGRTGVRLNSLWLCQKLWVAIGGYLRVIKLSNNEGLSLGDQDFDGYSADFEG